MSTEYDVESGAVYNTEKTEGSGKKHKKKKKHSFCRRVLEKKEQQSIGITIIAMFFAIIFDILRIIKNIILWTMILCIIAGSIAGIITYKKFKPIYDEYNAFATEVVDNSSIETFKPEQTTFIYDKDGKVLIKLRGNKDTAYLDYDDIPTEVIDAFVAVEDRSFWEHPGIDIKGLVRVAYDAVRTKGEEIHGASTIPQQLARNIFLTHEVSLERKFKEMLISIKLTEKYSKRQIMEFYVNNICFANAFYGLEAAARGYFNTTSADLTLSQLAYLCAIPNSPEYYNPYKYPERAELRRDKILGDMHELGLINSYEYEKAKREEIVIQKPSYEFNDYHSTYAIDCATQYLMEEDGFEFRYSFENNTDYKEYKDYYDEVYESAKQKLITGGYKIYTSLDSDLQTQLQSVLDEQLAFNDKIDEETGIYMLQGALTVVDNETGKVITLVGGRSQETDDKVYSLNRAFQSPRQPGSSIKPLIVYGPALMYGYNPNTVVYNISVSAAKKKGVDVQKLTGTPMTLQGALTHSKNGVAWQIFDRITPKYGMSFLEKMEFSTICPDDYYNAASLGGFTYGTTTVDMASAYSTLANHGEYRSTTCITSIKDSKGREIYKEKEPVQVYDRKQADVLVDMMQHVIKSGTANSMRWSSSSKEAAAGKTGTTNGSKDGWFCGITPHYSIAVWVGYDKPKTVNGMYGGTYPCQIWKGSMLKLLDGVEPITEFEKCEEYYEISNVKSGLLPDHAYEIYMPGRSDDEVISNNYTVFDYRSDRVIGEKVQFVIDRINAVSNTNPDWGNEINSIYNEGALLVDSIYGTRYTNEMRDKLNAARDAKIVQLSTAVPPAPEQAPVQ